MKKYILISFLIIFASSTLAKNSNFKILSSSPSQLVIQVTPQNWQTTTSKIDQKDYTQFIFDQALFSAEPGSAQLPFLSTTIALPPNGRYSLSVINSESNQERANIVPEPYVFEENGSIKQNYEPDINFYNKTDFYPAEIVQSEASTFRSYKTVKLRINPLQYSPARQSVKKFSDITIQINFFPERLSSNTFHAEKREDFYKQYFINYDQAKSWKITQPKQLTKSSQIFSTENWFKLVIGLDKKEGFYKVTGKSLKDSGIPVENIDPTTIQIFNAGGQMLRGNTVDDPDNSFVETSIKIVGGEDGSLDDNDYILFYGKPLQGITYNYDEMDHYIHYYDSENVYWFTFGKQAGKRIQERASLNMSGLQPETDFRDMVFHEEERTNLWGSGTQWLGHAFSSANSTFTQTFYMPNAVSDKVASYKFALAGLSTHSQVFDLYVNDQLLNTVSQTGGRPSGDFSYYSHKEHSLETNAIPLSNSNKITIEYKTAGETAYAYVDYVEIEYARAFKADNNMLAFYSPLRSGQVLYTIDSFNNNDIFVFDVTDFGDIAEVSGTDINDRSISFSDNAYSNIAKRYIATASTGFQTLTRIEQGTWHDNLRTSRDVDYIIITADDFVDQALQLKSLRENWNSFDALKTEVVRISDVYNQFSSGVKDAAAIRNFVVYAEQNWNQPAYVLLFGDGHYDYKNILKYNTPNLIFPYEIHDRSISSTRNSDDWYVYTHSSREMQMAIGRIPVQTVDEAQNIANKIIDYETKPNYGDWRKSVMLLADDEYVINGSYESWNTVHTSDSENLARYYVPKDFTTDKVYLIEHTGVRTASVSGITKPTANEAFIDKLNKGTLIVNFMGHGNDVLLTHERVFTAANDLGKIHNENVLPFWIAATCEFGHWDKPTDQSFAEKVFSLPNAGAIGIMASSRLAYSSDNKSLASYFFQGIFNEYEAGTGQTGRVGDALMYAKNILGNDNNSQKYLLFGDPTMRLGAPRYQAVIQKMTPDSIQALRKTKLEGYVVKDKQKWTSFTGKIKIRVLDTPQKTSYYTYEDGEAHRRIDYYKNGNIIFQGIANVVNGEFSVEFIVPKDISYNGTDGKVSLYFWNDDTDGSGYIDSLPVGGTAVNLVDYDGPDMQLHFGDEDFADGDYVPLNPELNVIISDTTSGVNTAGDIGHEISMVLDGNVEKSKDLTEFFQYDEGSYTTGKLQYPIFDLPAGEHTIQIKAWDNSNNSAQIETEFIVLSDEKLEIRNLLNYPNPARDVTTFSYELSQPAKVTLKIFTVTGRLIKSFEPVMGEIGFNVFPEEWDLTDQDGDQLANGVYLYKLTAKSIDAETTVTSEEINKLIIAQ